MINMPGVIVSADWGSSANKRWMVKAARLGDGPYLAGAPEPVGELSTLIERVAALGRENGSTGESSALIGFDFPIGLPSRYAELAGIDDFLSFLEVAGKGKWAHFFEVAETPDQIHLQRPFYPRYNWIGLPKAHAETPRQEELLRGLQVTGIDDLRRRCELRRADRRAAAPLFWTLGAQQAGKAAICGWQEVLQPALPRLAIWPFSGKLETLLETSSVTAVETYPAEIYTHLGLDLWTRRGACRSGKRVQETRQAQAEKLFDWASRLRLELHPSLQAAIQTGFGPSAYGEDAFDATIGLFGMLHTLLSWSNHEPPLGPRLSSVEGWIFGSRMPETTAGD